MTFTAGTVPILGLYVENSSGSQQFFGAPSAWPSGATTNIANTYVAFDAADQFNAYGAPFIQECGAAGLVPFVELEPWDYNQAAVPFSAITGGSWDTYLGQVGAAIAALGSPCIVTFGHEMNVSGQYPWSYSLAGSPFTPNKGSGTGGAAPTAAQWVSTWKYVHDKVNASAGGHALWMWACSADTGGSTTESPVPYWPGNSYVDMVGIDGYEALQGSPTTFSAVFAATLADIRGNIGWAGPVYIAETSLALMVQGGGDSIATFVADMAANGMSGILEFEAAGMPQMTSAQWAQYNNAVAADITPSSGGGGSGGGASGPGAANVVQWASNDTAGTSLTLTLASPLTPGNTVVLALAGYVLGAVTGVTIGGTPVTFAKEATSGGYNAELWVAAGNTVSSATIVVTTSTPGVIGFAYEVTGDRTVSVSAGTSGDSGSWASGSTGTAPGAAQAVIGLGACIADGGSVTGPSGGGWTNVGSYTGLQSGSGTTYQVGAVSGYLNSAGSAAYDYAGTLGTPGAWAAVTAAFQATAAKPSGLLMTSIA